MITGWKTIDAHRKSTSLNTVWPNIQTAKVLTKTKTKIRYTREVSEFNRQVAEEDNMKSLILLISECAEFAFTVEILT